MKEFAAFLLMIGGVLAGTTCGAITGSLMPNSISQVHDLGETRDYTLDYCIDIGGASGKADVLFLTDTTTSMGGYINGIKAAFDGILSSIDSGLPGLDIKYGVADYRNYQDGGNYAAYGLNLRQSFTSDTTAAQSAINTMAPEGGNDWPESQLKAFVNLANNWLTPSGYLGFGGRADAQKILIWAGDAEGHYFGEGGDGPPDYYPSLAGAIAALNAQGIVTFGLNTLAEGDGIDLHYGGDNQATFLTKGTGGRLFNNVSSASAEIQATIVNAVTAGVEILSNITLALQSDSYFLVEPLNQTVTGSWTLDNSPVCGSFDFDATAPLSIGSVDFDMVLLGNGAELDRTEVHLETVPEPTVLLLLGFGALALLRNRSSR